MRIPVIRGVIDRRILVNYRIDPDILAKILPQPFRPKLIHGYAVAGICLIRLKQVRPRFLPGMVGVSSENAAHRIAVEWEQEGELRQGVYVPRRDTSSRFNTLVGGRLFPGIHHHARFNVQEQGGQYSIVIDGDDLHLAVIGDVACEFPSNSIFGSLDEASRFFECGSVGYSPSRRNGNFEGLELHTFDWQVEPLAVSRVESSFFEDRSLFPVGSAEFDCALLMRNIEHEWHGRESLTEFPACGPMWPCESPP